MINTAMVRFGNDATHHVNSTEPNIGISPYYRQLMLLMSGLSNIENQQSTMNINELLAHYPLVSTRVRADLRPPNRLTCDGHHGLEVHDLALQVKIGDRGHGTWD